MDSSAWVLVNSKPNELGWRSPYIGSLAVVQNYPAKSRPEAALWVSLRLRVQAIDATHALNLSAGVSYSSVLLGRSFKRRATAFSLA
jgi:hypothetical protein